jgi:hypothetical protein
MFAFPQAWLMGHVLREFVRQLVVEEVDYGGRHGWRRVVGLLMGCLVGCLVVQGEQGSSRTPLALEKITLGR